MAVTPSFKHLEMFQLLMQTHSLTETARLLHVTQPAISHALREFEAQIGFELFVRGAGGIRPTAEATALLPEIERLFAQAGALSARMAELRDARAGELTLATVLSLSGRVLPRSIARFRADRPQVRIAFLIHTMSEVLSLVKQEMVEFGFAYSPTATPGIAAEPLIETELAAMLPPDHRLARLDLVRVEDLAGEVVIVPTTHTVPGLLLRDILDKDTIETLDIIEVNNVYAAATMVRERVGMALVDPLLLAGESVAFVGRPFQPQVRMTMSMLSSRHRPLSRVAVEFMARVRDAVAEDARQLQQLGIPVRVHERS